MVCVQDRDLLPPTKTILALRYVVHLVLHIPIVSVLALPLMLYIVSKNMSMVHGIFGSAPLTVLFIVLLRRYFMMPLAHRFRTYYVRIVAMHTIDPGEMCELFMEAVYSMDMIGCHTERHLLCIY